jgi:hypothetical protein
MHTTINSADQFRNAFRDRGRESHFSYEGLDMLFNHFEDNVPDMELDVVAICCGYSEEHIAEVIQKYSIDVEGLAYDEIENTVMDYLNNHTSVVGISLSGVVYASF